MKNRTLTFVVLISFLFNFKNNVVAQCYVGMTPDGKPCGGTLQTAVPFMRIVGDARSTAIGNSGIAISPDANAINFNASKLAMADKKWGSAISYTPWLRNLGVKTINLTQVSSYWQLDKTTKQTIGFNVRSFSLGNIQWTDSNGQPIGEGSPYEFSISAIYARKLSEKWSIGGSAKYIYSNLATGNAIPGSMQTIHSGKAVAIDLSTTFKTPAPVMDLNTNVTIGAAVSNVGNKINYLGRKDFLPTNLGIGAAWEINVDRNHRITLTSDANKLLVPTPDPNNPNWINQSVVSGILGSFSDAPGGFSEEMKEINISSGVEYWFKNILALRYGYFYENKEKGDRQIVTVGGGVRYKFINLNVSYWLATREQRRPYDNTWSVSLIADAF